MAEAVFCLWVLEPKIKHGHTGFSFSGGLCRTKQHCDIITDCHLRYKCAYTCRGVSLWIRFFFGFAVASSWGKTGVLLVWNAAIGKHQSASDHEGGSRKNPRPLTSEGWNKHIALRNNPEEKLQLSSVWQLSGKLEVTNQTRKMKPPKHLNRRKERLHNGSRLISLQTPAMSAATYPLITAVAILL